VWSFQIFASKFRLKTLTSLLEISCLKGRKIAFFFEQSTFALQVSRKYEVKARGWKNGTAKITLSLRVLVEVPDGSSHRQIQNLNNLVVSLVELPLFKDFKAFIYSGYSVTSLMLNVSCT